MFAKYSITLLHLVDTFFSTLLAFCTCFAHLNLFEDLVNSSPSNILLLRMNLSLV